jgi:hypothetical protein
MAKPDTTELSPQSALLALQAIRADLHKQRGAAVTEQARLAEERKRLARSALTGSKHGRQALDAVTASAAKIVLRLEEISYADDQVETEIAAATAALEAEQARARAEYVRSTLVPQMIAAGDQCQRGLDDFSQGMTALLGAAAEIARHGGGVSSAIVRVNIERAINAHLFLNGRLNSQPLDRAARSIPGIREIVGRFASTAASRSHSIATGEVVTRPDPPRGPGEPSPFYEEIPGWAAIEAAERHPVDGDPDIEEAAQ